MLTIILIISFSAAILAIRDFYRNLGKTDLVYIARLRAEDRAAQARHMEAQWRDAQ